MLVCVCCVFDGRFERTDRGSMTNRNGSEHDQQKRKWFQEAEKLEPGKRKEC